MKDLHLTGNKFNIALVVFYVPYVSILMIVNFRYLTDTLLILVDVPSNWIVKKMRAGFYLPFLITSWGVTSTFLGFTKSYSGLIAARFFLGLCEGGLLGGMIVYLAFFYRRHEMYVCPRVQSGLEYVVYLTNYLISGQMGTGGLLCNFHNF